MPMQILPQPLLCALNRHDADRQRAKWDGLHYVSQCKGCGRPVYRVTHRTWRRLGLRDKVGLASWAQREMKRRPVSPASLCRWDARPSPHKSPLTLPANPR
jgi:hypothetical protein